MDNSFDTSFIPQQPLLKVEGYSRRWESVNLSLIIAFVIFFSTLAVAGGMYLYKISLDRNLLALEKELQSKEAILKTADIDRYKAIDMRLNVVKQLLHQHTAFSTILVLLEKITAQDVGWTALSYATNDADGAVILSVGGQAPSYSAVYAQAEVWRTMPATLQKVEVSMPVIASPESSIVTFGAKLTIDPEYVKYARVLREGVSGDGGAVINVERTPILPKTNTSTTSPRP